MARVARERKDIDRLVPTLDVKAAEDVIIPEGSGEPLGQIDSVDKSIRKCKDEDLRALHMILFGKPGRNGQRKKVIRLFKGFAEDDPHNEERVEKLVSNKSLKEVCEQVSLSTSGNKTQLAERLNDFLMDPNSEATSAPSKRKASEPKATKEKKTDTKKSAKEKGPPTRPRSGYIQYVMENREALKEESPELSNVELMKKLGEQWQELDDSEKVAYNKAATEAFEAAGGPAAAAAAKKRKAEDKEIEKAAKKEQKIAEKASKVKANPPAKKSRTTKAKAKDNEEEEEIEKAKDSAEEEETEENEENEDEENE